jgi:maltose O-acetyltransferase
MSTPSISGKSPTQANEVHLNKHPSIAVEFSVLHVRYLIAKLLLAPLPNYFGGRFRTRILRWSGFVIGAGSVFWGTPEIAGQGNIYSRLNIGQGCWFNKGCFFDLSDSVLVGDSVSVGHEVLFLTSTHKIGPATRRAGDLYARPIQIGNGSWIGSRSTILPGVTIGEGAIVGAGALVIEDVAPQTLVGGIPAKVVRVLD